METFPTFDGKNMMVCYPIMAVNFILKILLTVKYVYGVCFVTEKCKFNTFLFFDILGEIQIFRIYGK